MRRLLKYITAWMLFLSAFSASVLPASAWPVDPDWEDATGTGYAKTVSDRYLDFLSGDTYKTLMTDDNFMAELTYKGVVNDSLTYSSILVSLWALEEQLDLEDCLHILMTIIQMQENNFTDSYADMARYDTLKSGAEYGLDFLSIETGGLGLAAAFFDDTATSRITTVLGLGIGAVDIHPSTVEELADVFSILDGYENHTLFLEAVRDNTEYLDEMREAADILLDVLQESAIWRLEMVHSDPEAVSGGVFSEAFLEHLKNSGIDIEGFDNEFMDNWTKTALDAGLSISGFGKAGKLTFDIYVAASDQLFGTTNIYRRFAEIEALHWTASAIQREIFSAGKMSHNPDENVQAAKRTVPLMQYLILIRARAEYCLEQLLYFDSGLHNSSLGQFQYTDDVKAYYAEQELFFKDAWREVSSILEYDEWPELGENAVSGGNQALTDTLAGLVSQYGVIGTGSEDYSGTGYGGGETLVPAEQVTGLLGADIYDYDGDGQDELLTVRCEPAKEYDTGESTGGWIETKLYLTVYEQTAGDSGGSVVPADEKTISVPGLPDTLCSSSIQFMRGVQDGNVALYLDYYFNFNTQSFSTIRLTYDGKLNVSGGVDCSEFAFAASCDSSASEGALETMGGRQSGSGGSRQGWETGENYNWEGQSAEIPGDYFESYRNDWQKGMEAIGLQDSSFRTMYDYAIPIIHEDNAARTQYYIDLCTRRPADTCAMTGGGTLTELCGILSPSWRDDSGMYKITFTCYDSTGLLDQYRGGGAGSGSSDGNSGTSSGSGETSASPGSPAMNPASSGMESPDDLFAAFSTAFLQHQDSGEIAALYGLESEADRSAIEAVWTNRLAEITYNGSMGISSQSFAGAQMLSDEEAADLCSAYPAPPEAACLLHIDSTPDWSEIWPDWMAGGIELYAAQYNGGWYLIPENMD